MNLQPVREGDGAILTFNGCYATHGQVRVDVREAYDASSYGWRVIPKTWLSGTVLVHRNQRIGTNNVKKHKG